MNGTGEKGTRTSLYIENDVATALELYAKKKGESRSKLVTKMIRNNLEKENYL
jgi:metal-responsive CopG/Arc/MetJ family transcriptional regulator